MFRTTFSQHAAVVWGACMSCGGQWLADCSSAVRGKPLRGGSIVVLHTHGRHGHYPPHLHLRATSGGDDGPGERWEPLQSWPDALLRRPGQWHLLTMRRQTLQTEAIHPL